MRPLRACAPSFPLPHQRHARCAFRVALLSTPVREKSTHNVQQQQQQQQQQNEQEQHVSRTRPLAQLVASGIDVAQLAHNYSSNSSSMNSRRRSTNGDNSGEITHRLSRRAAARLITGGFVEVLPAGTSSKKSTNAEGWLKPDGPGMGVDPLRSAIRVDRSALIRELTSKTSSKINKINNNDMHGAVETNHGSSVELGTASAGSTGAFVGSTTAQDLASSVNTNTNTTEIEPVSVERSRGWQVLSPASLLPKAPRLLLYFKRRGILVSNKDTPSSSSSGVSERNCVFDVLERAGVPGVRSLVSCGRLDFNTEGLLLLTDSGHLAQRITHPSFSAGMKRVYRVRVSGEMSPDKIRALERGLEVNLAARDASLGAKDGSNKKGRTSAPFGQKKPSSSLDSPTDSGAGAAPTKKVRFGPVRVVTGEKTKGNNFWLELHLHEGKNRQIRLSMQQLGLRVSRIIRIGFGPYSIEGMEAGEVREVPLKGVLKSFADDPSIIDATKADVRKLSRRVYRRRGLA